MTGFLMSWLIWHKSTNGWLFWSLTSHSTAKVIIRWDLHLNSHPKDLRSPGSDSAPGLQGQRFPQILIIIRFFYNRLLWLYRLHQTWDQNYNAPLTLRKTLVKVANFSIKKKMKNLKHLEIKLIGFIMYMTFYSTHLYIFVNTVIDFNGTISCLNLSP